MIIKSRSFYIYYIISSQPPPATSISVLSQARIMHFMLPVCRLLIAAHHCISMLYVCGAQHFLCLILSFDFIHLMFLWFWGPSGSIFIRVTMDTLKVDVTEVASTLVGWFDYNVIIIHYWGQCFPYFHWHVRMLMWLVFTREHLHCITFHQSTKTVVLTEGLMVGGTKEL